MARRWTSTAMLAAWLATGAAASQETSEAIATKSGVLASPEIGHGQVVFFRPSALMWAAMGCPVHEGGQQLARLGIGRYRSAAVAPGEHEFTTGKEKGRLHLRVEAGKTYFVMCSISKGLIGRARLSRSDADVFRDHAAGLTASDPI